ncbi:MAG: RdgB/HAM1 family non-canonical purine NTP pyrophosphatase [Burkholderiaceae bacterium]
MQDDWVLATGNPGKLAEMQRLLEGLGVRLRAQAALGVLPCAEPFNSFLENALEKARHASRGAGLPAIADDSGLVVDALGGAPGVRSARFYADAVAEAGGFLLPGSENLSVDTANWQWLLHRMQDVPEADRTARFVSVIAYVRHADDPMPIVGCGLWPGRVAKTAAGSHGFGYDCVFYDPLMGRTAAELSPSEKNAVSHRADAIRQFLALYGHAYS